MIRIKEGPLKAGIEDATVRFNKLPAWEQDMLKAELRHAGRPYPEK